MVIQIFETVPEIAPFSVDKLVLRELVVHVLEAEVGFKVIVVNKDHVLCFASFFASDGFTHEYHFSNTS